MTRRARRSSCGSISSVAREADAAVAQDLEPAPLERVAAAHGVDFAGQAELLARRLAELHRAADRDVHVADLDRRVGRPEVVAAQHQVARHGDAQVQVERVEDASAGASRQAPASRRQGAARIGRSSWSASVEYGSAVTCSSTRANVDRAVLDFDEPFDPRLAQLAGEADVGIQLQVGELVVDHLEVLRLDLDVDRADRALVHRQRPADGHHLRCSSRIRISLIVDGVRLEIDAGVEAGVCGAQVGNRERAAADVDDAVEVRVVAGAGHLDVRLQRAGDVGDIRREALDDAQVDLAARDLQVDRFAGRRQLRVARGPAGLRRNSVSGA